MICDSDIIAMAKEGSPPVEIQRRLASRAIVRRDYIYAVLARARGNGETIPKFTAAGRTFFGPDLRPKPLYVDRDAFALLAKEAVRRRIDAASLARKIIETVCIDDLFAAVLDEESP